METNEEQAEEEWADVVAEHKAFLKEEASRQLDLALGASRGPPRKQRSAAVGSAASAAHSSVPKDMLREGKRARGNAGACNEPAVVPKHRRKKKQEETGAHGNCEATSLGCAMEEADEQSCVICRRASEEDQLLLCDGCDLAFHTFCLEARTDCPLPILRMRRICRCSFVAANNWSTRGGR